MIKADSNKNTMDRYRHIFKRPLIYAALINKKNFAASAFICDVLVRSRDAALNMDAAGFYLRRCLAVCMILFIMASDTAFASAEKAGTPVSSDYAANSVDVNVSGSITNTAGSPDKTETSSDSTGKPYILPDIYRASMMILGKGENDNIKKLEAEIIKALSDGKEYEAAKILGAHFGKEYKNSGAYLGFYCRKLLPLVRGGLEKEVSFLSGFVKGYGKTGVLVISKEGVDTLRVFGRHLGFQWKTVPEGTSPEDKLERIYSGRKAVFIPFAAGEIFKVYISGAAKGTAKMWKILPSGFNLKSWKGGQWEREVTVRGDKLY